MSDDAKKYDLEVDLSVPEGMRVTTDRPYRILILAELTQGDSDPMNEGLAEVSAENVHELLAAAAPEVHLQLTDPLGSAAMAEAAVRFDSLRSFEPRQLIERIPATRSIGELREKLKARLLGKLDSDGLSRTVAEAVKNDPSLQWLTDAIRPDKAAPASSRPADPGKVGTLMDQLDLGDDGQGSSGPPRSTVGSLVAAASGGGSIPAGESTALRKAMVELDRRLSLWLTAVLHAPQVQNLEAGWRAVAWLAANVDFRKGVRLSVLSASRDSLVERFTSRVIDPVFDEGMEAPDVIIVNHSFANTAADMETLDELAQHAASLPAVMIAGLSASFFGVKFAWQIPTLPPLINLLDQWQYAKWKTLRTQSYARYLGLVFGKCLLRRPHGMDGDGEKKDLEFHYVEPCSGDKDVPWAAGSLAAAYAVAHSVADTGWPSGMAGQVHGRVEDLPRFQVDAKQDKWLGPADTTTPQARVDEMGMCGINAFINLPGREDGILWNGLSIAKPKKSDSNSLLEVSLPYQLFAGRLSSLLLALKPQLKDRSADSVIQTVQTHVLDWLGVQAPQTPEAVSVQVRPLEDRPGVMQLVVTVTPPSSILPGEIPIVMGYPIEN